MMPVFNATSFVVESLESVLAQDFPSFEVVLYDDGSTDGTADLVRERFADDRVRVYRSSRNRGAVYARNHILRLTRGEYLVAHDDDDVMLPGRLREQARCLDRYPHVGVVVGNFYITGPEAPGDPRLRTPWVTTGTVRRRLRGLHGPGPLPCPVHHCASMMRRSVLLAAGGYDRRWEGVEDIDLLTRLAPATRFYFLDRVAYVYRRRPDGLTGRMRKRSEQASRLLAPGQHRFRNVLRVSGSCVEITADCARPLRVIRERLAADLGLEPVGGGHRDVGIELRLHGRSGRWRDLGFDAEALSRLRRYGVAYRLDGATRLASVLVDPGARVSDDMIFHAGFLQPLSHALHDTGATLAHAALVAKGAAGVLMMGDSGCGKSTLALALVQRGCRYFSDEHPILTLRDGEVVGQGFASRIAVPPPSMRNFPGLLASSSWNARRGKWYVDPARVAPGGLGDRCRIDTVIFPHFRATARFSARRLSPLRFFQRLQQDAFYSPLTRQGEAAAGAREAHVRLQLRLVSSAVAFAITYGVGDVPRVSRWLEARAPTPRT